MPAVENKLTLADHVASFKRRKWPMTIVGGTVLVIAVLTAFIWPATYKSTGTILIEQQELPAELVRSTISSYADQRLQVITQRVMTTDNLFKIIQRYDLYEKMRKTKVRELVIQRMRDDIKFDMISADVIDPRFGHPTKATIAFSISYSNRSPELAAKVANELVSLYLQENVESRAKRAADATTFLTDEADRLNLQIEELQKKMVSFKEEHLHDLPELAPVNLQLMTRSEEELREIDSRMRSLDQQLVYLDAQLAQLSPSSQVYTSTGERVLSPADRLKYLRTEYARVSGLYAPTHPDVLRLQREITGLEKDVGAVDQVNDLDRQWRDANTKLQSAKQRYATDHPDVVRLSRQVESLSEKMAELREQPAVPQSNINPDNPAYIQVKSQREASSSERDSLRKKRSELQVRLRELEGRLESAPAVERDYTALVRDLDNAQLKYREVRQKQMEAQVSQNLEDERKGERFTLIEPPLVPEEPASPNRVVIVVLGVVLSLAAAIGTMVLFEATDGSVRNRRDLAALLSVPPLAVLPWIETEADRLAKKRTRRYSVSGAIASAVLMVTLVHFLYRPLDVLWQVALRRVIG
jgi:polysaccharide biosynthesis transport protein